MQFKYKSLLYVGLIFLLVTGCSTKADVPEKKTTLKNDTKPNLELQQVVKEYHKYAIEQTDLLVEQTESFTQAVKAGDIEKAKQLYAPTRMYFERIEPIAESLGDFDPKIDARENDVPPVSWTGFHHIEKALWQKNTTTGEEKYADQLLQDVQLLRAKMETVTIDPNLLITGSVELLNEVSASKVTGEEERYSHTDLYDFVANVEGSQQIFTYIKPILEKKNASLANKIQQQFTMLQTELAKYKQGDGYVLYGELSKDQVKKLSQLLDALAEPLSQIGTILGGS